MIVKSIMKRETKFILIFLAVLLTGGSLFALPAKAIKADDLVVEYWTGTEWKKWLSGEESFPIFEEENFLPGDTAASLVRVTNNSGQSQNIVTEAIKWPGFPQPNNVPTNDLSRVLEITISQQDGSDVYGGSTGQKTLFNFYQDGEILLTEGLAGNGGQVIYNFQISFPKEEENQWQGATTTFDILIGFQGTEGGGTGGNGGTGSGGGGTILPRGLTILEESVTTTEVNTTGVTIKWQTTYFSTSQVIYAKQGETYEFDLSKPNYGYPHAAPVPEDKEKVTVHSVVIKGLDPDTEYHYRCVSHASPPSISREYKFTTLKEKVGKILPTAKSGKGIIMARESMDNASGNISKNIPEGGNEESGLEFNNQEKQSTSAPNSNAGAQPGQQENAPSPNNTSPLTKGSEANSKQNLPPLFASLGIIWQEISSSSLLSALLLLVCLLLLTLLLIRRRRKFFHKSSK